MGRLFGWPVIIHSGNNLALILYSPSLLHPYLWNSQETLMGGGKLFYEEHHSHTHLQDWLKAQHHRWLCCLFSQPNFLCCSLAGSYATFWPKNSGAVLIYAHPCHSCIFQHQAFAYGPLWQVYYLPCLCPRHMPAGAACFCFIPYWPTSCQKSFAGSECLWVSSAGPWGKPVLFSVYPLTKHWQTQDEHTTFLQEEVNWPSAWLCPSLCKIIKRARKNMYLVHSSGDFQANLELVCSAGVAAVYSNSGIFTSVYYQQEANCLRNARQMALGNPAAS